MTKTSPRKYKWLRIIGIVTGSILLLIVLASIWIQTSSAKNFIRNKAISYLQNKIGTEVKIGKLNYSIPNSIELEDVLFIDKRKDTLLSGQSLRVDINMFKLVAGKIAISEIHLKNIKANINRKFKDSSFNFQYIVDAFTGNPNDSLTSKKVFQLSLDKLFLDSVSLNFSDEIRQLFCTAFTGDLHSRIGAIDLDKMNFKVTDFVLNNTIVTVINKSTKKQKAAVAAAAKESPLNLFVSNFDVHNLKISYANISSRLDYNNLIDTFKLSDATLALSEELFTAKSITLSNSKFSMITNDPGVIVKDTIAKVINIASEKGWTVKIDAVYSNKNNVTIDNNAFPVAKEGLDYNHLSLKNISLQTNGIYYNTDTINADILNSTILLNNFLIKNIKANLLYNDTKATLKGFLFNTQNSLIAADGEIIFNRVNNNAMLNESSKVNINIKRSYADNNDLLFFIPSYKKNSPVTLKPHQKVLFNGKADGTLKEIDIALLDIKTDDGSLLLHAKGKVKNVLDKKKLQYDVVVNNLYVDKNILSENIHQQLKKQKINLPSNMMVNGTVNGNMKDVNAKLKLSSPFGLADINATANNFTDTKNMQYNIDLTGTDLQTGKWIYQDSLLGLFTGNLKINGNGIDYKTASVKTTVAAKSLVVKGYSYTNVNIDADLQKGVFATKADINDDNLITAIDLNGTVDSQYPTVKGTVVIDKADLLKLKFIKDSINIHTTIFIDAENLDPKKLNAVLRLDSNIITYNSKRLYADSISIKANAANDSTKLFVSAPFIHVNMIGKYDYANLPTAINTFIQHNYFKKNTDTLKIVDQQMVLNATIMQDSIIKEMIPGLTMDKPVIIHAAFDNTKKDTSLVIAANIPSVLYNNLEADNISLNANAVDSTLKFNLTTNYVIANGKKFYNAGVIGSYNDNALKVSVRSEDAKQKQFYAISSVIEFLKDETKIHLSDSLLLNYEKWNVSKNNSIEIKNDGYIVTNFVINKNKESIVINNKEATVSSPIILKINDFDLAEVFAIANQDRTIAGGILNVDVTIEQPVTSLPKVIGTAAVEQLTYKKVAIGNVNLKTEIGNDKIISVKGGISGPNNLTIDGGYNTNDNTFVISSQVQQLNLKAVEAFSQGQLKRTSGNVHGNLFVNGTINDPRWKGELVFDTAQLSTAMFGSLYKINNQKIDFDYPNIGMYDFTITDSLNNTMVIDGTIKSQPDKDLALNLNVNTENFIAVNQPRTSNALLYGIGIFDAAILIGGTITAPDFSGKITLNDKSDIHYDLPAKSNYADDLKEVIKFIDIDTIKYFNNRNTIFTSAADTAVILKYQGLKYNLNLEVKEDANITILFDPSTGDELKIKGNAQLNAGVDENGSIGITGVYRLTKGSYDLTYQFIKKRFNLIDGSTITFSGDPMEAQADITAVYEVEASPQQLLSNEVAGNATTLGTAYTNKIPFEVILKIKGTLIKPNLSFDIKVKDNAEGINTALSTTLDNKLAQYRIDTSEMNKQVFALLILGRFISDKSSDFFATNNSTSPNDMVRQSVSKFLAEAVAQIAADLIKGVDISLDLKNYQADPATNLTTRTDLNLALSKQLLNDRLIVTVGKSYTIDGTAPAANTQNNSTTQFLPDISTTYKLSKDGRYALKVYRKNQYETIMDGYFIETGITFSFTMSYEKFKEIFQKEKMKSGK